MATKSKPKYPNIQFNTDQFPGCCGIGVAYNFNEEYGTYDWSTGRPKSLAKVHSTRTQQALTCLAELKEQLLEDYRYLQVALVSKYEDKRKGMQYPELQDALIEDEWTIQQVFINPNHGNEVTVFCKYFPE